MEGEPAGAWHVSVLVVIVDGMVLRCFAVLYCRVCDK